MGRSLFWGKIVNLLWFLLLPAYFLDALPDWLGSKEKAGLDFVAAGLPARQGHVGPAVYGIDFPINEIVRAEMRRLEAPHSLELLDGILQRGGKYRDFIMARLVALHLPPEIFYLALVESEYESRAVSAAGASGLWQLMDFTAASFSLVIDEIRDERMDFWKATDAALSILTWNHERYGDWLLAMAAYNAGCGAVDQAIARSGSRDFFVLVAGGFLPAETAAFVPRILAVAVLAGSRGRHGLTLSWKTGCSWTRIALPAPVDLRSLSEASSVPIDILTEANAELKLTVTPPGTGYFIKIPAGYTAQIREALQQAPEDLLRHSLHLVRSGDTLYSLARYYGISLSRLQEYNPRIAPEKLPVGARIVIPARGEALPPPPRAVLFTGKAFSEPYTVKAGDTLYALALRFRVPVEELAERNGLTLDAKIRPGETLNVPALPADK